MLEIYHDGKQVGKINLNFETKIDQIIKLYGKEYKYEITFNKNKKVIRVINPLQEIVAEF